MLASAPATFSLGLGGGWEAIVDWTTPQYNENIQERTHVQPKTLKAWVMSNLKSTKTSKSLPIALYRRCNNYHQYYLISKNIHNDMQTGILIQSNTTLPPLVPIAVPCCQHHNRPIALLTSICNRQHCHTFVAPQTLC